MKTREELIEDLNSRESTRQLQKRLGEAELFIRKIREDCEIKPEDLRKPMNI